MALSEYKAMEERCSNCLGCKWIPFDKVQSARFGENCPTIAFSNFNAYSARGRFQLGLALQTGDAPLDGKASEVIRECLTCGACDVACKVTRYNLEPLEHNLELKAHAVAAGKVLPVQTAIVESLAKEKTMIVGRKKADRTAWAEGLGLKDLGKAKGDVLFFPGCKYAYDTKLSGIARASVRVLKKAGVDLGYLGAADMCCAGRALQMGFNDEFERSARANIKAIEAAGVKTIVTPCSDCYHAFKRQYARLGLKVEVLHVVEYMARLIKEGRLVLTKTVPLTVTYHDPCHLGRLGEPFVPWSGTEKKILNQVAIYEPNRPRYNGAYGVYDAPRDVIRSVPGVRLVEMERIREYSWCCGSGGGCGETSPELSSWTASERIVEAEATSAQAFVTACPWCESAFKAAADATGSRLKILDVVELVELAL